MSRVRGHRSAATYVQATVVVLAVAVGLFFLIRPLITALGAVTGGSWRGDLAVGIAFVLLPLAIIIAYGLVAHRNGWRQRWGWCCWCCTCPRSRWSRSAGPVPTSG